MENQIEFENSTFHNSYATILDWGNLAGMLVMVVTFIPYVLGLTTPLVPFDELPNYWGLNLSQYLEKTGVTTGWDWVFHLNRSEYQNYLGIVILGGITFVCYSVMFFHFLKKGKITFAIMAISELFILLIASINY